MINLSDLYKEFKQYTWQNLSSINKQIIELKRDEYKKNDLKKLVTLYESYIKLEKLSCSDFYKVLEHINSYYEHELLIGNRVNLGTGVGSLVIKNKRITKSNTRINWGESNALKQEIIDKGYTPYKERTNKKGIKWLIYNEEDIVPYIVWNRPQTKDSKLISVIFNKSNNTGLKLSLLNKTLSKEEILSNRQLGITRKIRLLINNDITYKNIFYDI